MSASYSGQIILSRLRPLTEQQPRPTEPRVITQPRPSKQINMPNYRSKLQCIGILLAVLAALAAVIVVPLAFSYLEYYEYGLKRQKSTGIVFLDKVYKGGRHLHGPDYDFLVYKADAHFLDLIAIDVFTRDKLEVKLTAHMQYVLREDQLTLLHGKFNVFYEDVMKTSAVDALKGAIPVFTTRELVQNRSAVETELYRAVRQRIGGICCRPDCRQYAQACPVGCKPVKVCSDKDKGLHADVIQFQLGGYKIPSDVEVRYMEALLLQETTLREQLRQNASVVRKGTEALVKAIKNNATEVTANATAQASLIQRIANSDYNRMTEEAKITGLVSALKKLKITEQDKKLSYDYLRVLLGNENVRLAVNFEKLLIGKT